MNGKDTSLVATQNGKRKYEDTSPEVALLRECLRSEKEIFEQSIDTLCNIAGIEPQGSSPEMKVIELAEWIKKERRNERKN